MISIIFLSMLPMLHAEECTAELQESTVSLLQHGLHMAGVNIDHVHVNRAGSSEPSVRRAHASATLLNASGDGDLNLCRDGHLAPELFVLGYQKAGTTTFCDNLVTRYTEIRIAKAWPEWMYHYAKEPSIFNMYDRFNDQKGWHKLYPTCQQRQRQVAIDCTPYLGSGWDPFGIPQRIHQSYPHNFSRLRFVVLMREPVARMQSAFYYARERKWPEAYLNYESFQSYIDDVLARQEDLATKGDDPHAYNESIYNMSRYDLWIENLLSEPGMRPEQLVIVPMRLAFHPAGNQTAVALMAEQLGIHSEPSQTHGGPGHSHVLNPTSHPHLEDDLTESTLAAMRELLDGATSVAKALTSHGVGATWFGYDGSLGNESAIAQWLESNW